MLQGTEGIPHPTLRLAVCVQQSGHELRHNTASTNKPSSLKKKKKFLVTEPFKLTTAPPSDTAVLQRPLQAVGTQKYCSSFETGRFLLFKADFKCKLQNIFIRRVRSAQATLDPEDPLFDMSLQCSFTAKEYSPPKVNIIKS